MHNFAIGWKCVVKKREMGLDEQNAAVAVVVFMFSLLLSGRITHD